MFNELALPEQIEHSKFIRKPYQFAFTRDTAGKQYMFNCLSTHRSWEQTSP